MFATQFDREEASFRNRKTATATIVTIVVHGLLLLFFLFSILQTPIPPFTDNAGGMSVNFGTDETGVGDEQPFTYNPGATAASAAASKPQPVVASPDKVLTEDNEDNNVTVPKADDKPKHKIDDKAVFKRSTAKSNANSKATATSVAPVAPQPKPNANAMFSKGAYGAPNNSKGDGTGGAQGDQGKPNGDPNSRSYLGDGNGNGEGHGAGDLKGGYSLRGRKRLSQPEACKCNTQGKVVIAIKVDRTGKVVDASFLRFKSTAVETCNINCALTAARQTPFNADPNAPEIQEGTITFTFEVH